MVETNFQGLKARRPLPDIDLHSQRFCILRSSKSQRQSATQDLMITGFLFSLDVAVSFVASQGKIAVIDHNPRRGEKMPFDPPKKERYKARSLAERVNSSLKDGMGITGLRYKGPSKIMTHLSFGLLAIATEQILKTI